MFTFILLLTTGLAMIFFNLQGQNRESRDFLVLTHEIFALLFLAVPLLSWILSDKKIWRENIRLAFHFDKEDILWLMKKPLVGFVKGIELPKEDKFNAGQKVWVTVATICSLILSFTGVIIWVYDSAILSLFIHTSAALFVIPFLSGHMYMALVNPETREGITCIIDGEVSVHYGEQHHPLWMERLARERVLEKATGDGERKEDDEIDPNKTMTLR